ncbi:MAG: NAD(P)/FAD-dependent oxidoreductase [Bacteroidota bacterium]
MIGESFCETSRVLNFNGNMTRKRFLMKSAMGLLGVSCSSSLIGHRIKLDRNNNMSVKEIDFEVIIIGGSYSGLSAAMTLGRSMRKTLIIDAGKPCNRQTPYSHNFITQDGREPAAIASDALTQVLAYDTVQIVNDLVKDVNGLDQKFTVYTQSGKMYTSKKLIFATGVRDIMPDIPGFAQSWGITVIHCPYCHGYEVRGKNTGILVNNDTANEFVQLIKHWTPQVTVFTNGPAHFDYDLLQGSEVPVIEKAISKIEHHNGHLTSLRFEDGSDQELDALYHRPAFVQHCEIPEKMGCELEESGHLKVTPFQQTNIPGIYAVGDCTTPFRSVANAVAQGNIGAAMLNHDLITES